MATAVDMMVVAAHPDDAEFGVAGTVAKWVNTGKQVVYVVCTNGNKGTSDRDMKPEQLAAIREKEQRAAAKVLGIGNVEFLGYPDQGLEDTPEFRKEIVRMIRTYRPRIIATSNPYRRYVWHRDHRIVGQVVLDAVFPFARDHMAYPDLLEEGFEPHKVEEVWFWASEDINYRSDITDTFHLKLSALRCHESQIREMNRPNFDDWLKGRYRSLAEGEAFELAEAFHKVELPK